MASVAKYERLHKGETIERWVVRYTDQAGKRRQKNFKKKKDADRYRTHVETEIEKGVHVAPSQTLTFAKVSEEWMRDCEVRNKNLGSPTRSFIKNYQGVLDNHLLPAFGHRLMTELHAEELQAFLTSRSKAYAYGSLQQFRTAMSLVVKFAVKKGYAKQNVVRDGEVRVPSAPQKIAIPSRADLAALLTALSRRDSGEKVTTFMQRRLFVVLALFCGMRLGEICGLQWEFVDFAAGRIRVRHSYSEVNGLKQPKTHASVRDVPMVPIVRAALAELRDHLGGPDEGFLFMSCGGKNMRSGFDIGVWRPLMKKAGLAHPAPEGQRYGRPKFHFHALRHAAVSLLIAKGLNGHQVAPFVGHSKVSTTLDVYGHLFPEDNAVESAMNTISGGILPEWETTRPSARGGRRDHSAIMAPSELN